MRVSLTGKERSKKYVRHSVMIMAALMSLQGLNLIPIFIAYDNSPVMSQFCNKDCVMDYFIVFSFLHLKEGPFTAYYLFIM